MTRSTLEEKFKKIHAVMGALMFALERWGGRSQFLPLCRSHLLKSLRGIVFIHFCNHWSLTNLSAAPPHLEIRAASRADATPTKIEMPHPPT